MIRPTYLLDTNILSDLIRNPDGAVASTLIKRGIDRVCTSIIVVSEMRYGASRRGSQSLMNKINQLTALIPARAYDFPADEVYGRIRAELERDGKPIGLNDLFIAAQAIADDLILVSDNIREFSRIEGLKLENWLR